MKNILTRSIPAFALLIMMVAGFSSCKKYLEVEPVSSFGTDYVFDNVINAEKAVLGTYYSLTGDNGYGIRLSMYYTYDTDLMMGQAGRNDNERRDIAHYNATPNNTQLPRPFNQLYDGVERANLCIYNIPLMDEYNNGNAQQKNLLKRLHGEALTLRAQFYFELIRNWGDVPAQFQPSALEPDLFKSKMDRDSIYDRLLEDLQLASTLVPWRSEVAKDERITQGAVRALRAKIALFRGGYSLRRNKQMERGSNHLAYYQIAKDETQAVMQSNQHLLNPSYESVFKNYIAGRQIEPNGEVVWEVAMGGGNSGLGDSKLGYYNGPRSNNNGNSALTVLPNYFYMFDENDLRRDVMCVPYYILASGSTVTARTGRNLNVLMDGKFRRDWIPDGVITGPQYFGVNWPLIRYSDVLLMFAEADNELSSAPSPAAIAAFEQVRKRAFGGDVTKIGTTPTTKNGFFDAIVKERALEFGGEGIRKYDLIRWNLLATKLAETKATIIAMSNRQAPYNQLPDYMFFKTDSPQLIWANPSYYAPNPFGTTAPAGFTRVDWVRSSLESTLITNGAYAEGFEANKKELLPIPQESIDANPRLTQDYGY